MPDDRWCQFVLPSWSSCCFWDFVAGCFNLFDVPLIYLIILIWMFFWLCSVLSDNPGSKAVVQTWLRKLKSRQKALAKQTEIWFVWFGYFIYFYMIIIIYIFIIFMIFMAVQATVTIVTMAPQRVLLKVPCSGCQKAWYHGLLLSLLPLWPWFLHLCLIIKIVISVHQSCESCFLVRPAPLPFIPGCLHFHHASGACALVWPKWPRGAGATKFITGRAPPNLSLAVGATSCA